MITTDHRRAVIAKLRECIETISAHYGVDLNMPQVEFSHKMTNTAGMAYYRKNQIVLSAPLMANNFDEMVNVTVPHELAHLATQAIYPEAHRSFDEYGRRQKREPHGPRWKEIMGVLGADDSRTHSMKVVERKRVQYEYHCVRCEKKYRIGAKRHKTQLAHNNKYYRCKCGADITYVSTIQPTRPGISQKAERATATTASTGGMTKAQQCKAIYDANRTASRAEVIEMFISQVGMTKAGASTYYQNCKK